MDLVSTMDVPLKVRLLLRLSQLHLSISERQHIETLLRGDVRWGELVRLAVQHKLTPLVYHNLSTSFEEVVPEEVMQRLRLFFRVHFRRSFYLRSELPGLLELLADHGIDAIPFKGPILAAMAYPNEKLRPYLDLDVLIHADDVDKTVHVLKEAGFEECNPLPRTYESSWTTFLPFQHVHGNANGYVRDEGTPKELSVDVHWGLASHYFALSLDPDELWTRRRTVELGTGYEVSTFSLEDTLLFLCIHGSKHGMDRLSYVHDVAAFVQAHPDLDWDGLLDTVRSFRVERMLLLNLYLAAALFQAPLPSVVDKRIEALPGVRFLAREVCIDLFEGRDGLSGIYRTCRFHLRVRDRWWDGLGAVYYNLQLSMQPTPEDRAWVEIPRSLSLLYYLVRPLRLAWEGMTGRMQR